MRKDAENMWDGNYKEKPKNWSKNVSPVDFAHKRFHNK
jgi:hypothetical protein